MNATATIAVPINADEESLAYHTEPMQRAKEALECSEGVGGDCGRHL